MFYDRQNQVSISHGCHKYPGRGEFKRKPQESIRKELSKSESASSLSSHCANEHLGWSLPTDARCHLDEHTDVNSPHRHTAHSVAQTPTDCCSLAAEFNLCTLSMCRRHMGRQVERKCWGATESFTHIWIPPPRPSYLAAGTGVWKMSSFIAFDCSDSTSSLRDVGEDLWKSQYSFHAYFSCTLRLHRDCSVQSDALTTAATLRRPGDELWFVLLLKLLLALLLLLPGLISQAVALANRLCSVD